MSLAESIVNQELTSLIYASVSDSKGWAEFLAEFARAVEAPRSALLIADSDEGELSVVRWHGWPDEDIRLYVSRYQAADPWRLATPELVAGTVAADYEICPRDQFEGSLAFREFYGPRDCGHGMGGIILTTATAQSAISSSRGREAGPFGEKEKSVLRAVMPHLQRAALLHGEIGSLRRQLATFTGHLERYPYAFLLADAKRRVLYSNGAARQLVRMGDGLAIEDQRIVATLRKEAFDEAAAAIAMRRGPSIRRLEIRRLSGRKPYRVILMAVGEGGTMPLGVSVPSVSIVVIDPHSSAMPDTEVLRELFSLTPSEARVAASLAMGRSVEETAAEFVTSLGTVRTHVKRILAKTSTARQGELISLIFQTVPFQRSEAPTNDGRE